MSIVCKDCGFENENGEKFCAMCNADLSSSTSNSSFPEPHEKDTMMVAQVKTVAQTENVAIKPSTGTKIFFVNCENARTKTIVHSANITSYFCDGCKEEHQIDGFFWIVQEEVEENTKEPAQSLVTSTIEQVSSGNGQHLVLEDVDTHMKIEISTTGGTFGRYGTYGSAYLQSDPRGRMVSGEHCRFKYEYGRWSIEHLSRTNDTILDGRKLEHGLEEPIRNGKIITFANAISFKVRIL